MYIRRVIVVHECFAFRAKRFNPSFPRSNNATPFAPPPPTFENISRYIRIDKCWQPRMETGNLGVVDKDNGDSARVGNDSSIEKPSNVSILIVIRSPARSVFQPLKITRYTKLFKASWTKLVKNRGGYSRRFARSIFYVFAYFQ